MLVALWLALAPVCTPDGDPCNTGEDACEVGRAYWHNECGRHAIAADQFAELYTKDPRPVFLYNAANASRLAGDCWTALAFYKRFLDLGPPEDEAVLATKNVERCRAQIAAARGRAANVPPPRVTDDVHRRDDVPPPPKHWSRDPAGAGLVGAGLGLVAIGVGILAGAGWHDTQAQRATTDASFGDHLRARTSLIGVGAPIVAAGGGLVLSGIIRWAVVARDNKRRSAR